MIGPLSVEDPDNKNSNRQNHTCTLLTYSDTFEVSTYSICILYVITVICFHRSSMD